jgi:hypothetical protein
MVRRIAVGSSGPLSDIVVCLSFPKCFGVVLPKLRLDIEETDSSCDGGFSQNFLIAPQNYDRTRLKCPHFLDVVKAKSMAMGTVQAY